MHICHHSNNINSLHIFLMFRYLIAANKNSGISSQFIVHKTKTSPKRGPNPETGNFKFVVPVLVYFKTYN